MRLVVVAFAAVLSFAATAHAAPQVSAQGREERVASRILGPIRLYDTTWWVEVRATSAAAPVARLDYRARFMDAVAPPVQTGSWEVSPATDVTGQVKVTCAGRADYDRPLKVSLRAVDSEGAIGDWFEVEFPVPAAPPAPGQELVAVQVEPPRERRTEMIGTVEVVASESMTMGDVRTELQRRAKEMGGDAAVDLKIVDSNPERMVMRANVLRYVNVPIESPTRPMATPTAGPASFETVLGEISLAVKRR